MSKTASCTKCDKSFTKKTQMLADQALRMHVGRKHSGTIIAHNQHSGVLRQRSNGALVEVGSRSHLSGEEATALVGFLRERHQSYPTRQACFTAALEAVGVRDKIKDTSGAVARYFDKALSTDEDRPKRKYTRRQQTPVVQEVKVNFCPNCGCNIHAVATGIAMATHIK